MQLNIYKISPIVTVLHFISLPVAIFLYVESIMIQITSSIQINIVNYPLLYISSFFFMVYFITQVGITYLTLGLIQRAYQLSESSFSNTGLISILFFGLVNEIPILNQVVISFYLSKVIDKLSTLTEVKKQSSLIILNVILNGLTSGIVISRIDGVMRGLLSQQYRDQDQGSSLS
jgi:hypothetical protein